MDPIAHSFTGAALAAAGLRRKTALGTAALVLGANAPDIDIVSAFGAQFQSLAFRRGWTHGVLALALLPFALTGLLLLYDRHVRRRRDPSAAPARAGPLLGLCALAVLSHPALDWLNNYGIRLLMPFDGRWFYGDAAFIVDPWIWLGLGGVLFLRHTQRTASLAAWTGFWLLATILVLAAADVPAAARIIWLLGLIAFAAARISGYAAPAREPQVERAARVAVAAVAVYVLALAGLDVAEEALVRAELEARGVRAVERVMIAPVPANPFAGGVVVDTSAAYLFGRWRWLGEPKLTLEPETIAKNLDDPLAAAAAQTPGARRYLTWARFPYALVERDGDAQVVRFFDARYHPDDWLGPVVRFDAGGKLIAADGAPGVP